MDFYNLSFILLSFAVLGRHAIIPAMINGKVHRNDHGKPLMAKPIMPDMIIIIPAAVAFFLTKNAPVRPSKANKSMISTDETTTELPVNTVFGRIFKDEVFSNSVKARITRLSNVNRLPPIKPSINSTNLFNYKPTFCHHHTIIAADMNQYIRFHKKKPRFRGF